MKRDRITLEQLAARDNLMLAVWKASKGKRQRPAVAKFLATIDERVDRLSQDILDERVPAGRVRRFTIRDPKWRVITAACFEDRVLHHAILNLAEPRFERMLMPSTYACRPEKGVHRAARAVQQNLRRWPWVVRVDVASYFASIDHRRLESLLARRFKGEAFLALLSRILSAGAVTPGCGLPIGALTSQHFANAYLDGADRWLLSHPKVRAHVRYMDDIAWWCDSRDDAVHVLGELEGYLRDEWALQVKPGAHVGRSDHGLAYCGFRVRQGVVLASRRKLARYRAGVHGVEAARSTGAMAAGDAQRMHDVLLAGFAGTTSIGFRRRLLASLQDNVDGCA